MVGDGEETRRRGVVELREHLRQDRPVALLAEDALRLGRAQEVDEGLGLLRIGRLGDDGDGVLDEDRLIRDDVLELFALLLGGDGLVLIGDQHVAFAAGEGGQRLARALVQHRNVSEELAQVLDGLFLGLALLELGAVGGHDVPAGAAGGERVRGDDLDALLEQIVPGGDLLRVVRTDGEDDDGVGHHAVVLVGIPVLGDKTRFDEAGDVRLEGEGNDIGRQTALDGAALLAGGRERGLERRHWRPSGVAWKSGMISS